VDYQIRLTKDGLADAKALPKNAKNFLGKEIKRLLTKDPIGCSDPLDPPLEKYRSCYIGDYRVVFHVDNDLPAIAIAGIGKHSRNGKADIYKKLEAIAINGQLAQRILATLKGLTDDSST
jgi:mRNA-degrading endonuclease RelE of RelBE toxin-antitoxin system